MAAEEGKYIVNGILWRRVGELGEEKKDWLSLRDILALAEPTLRAMGAATPVGMLSKIKKYMIIGKLHGSIKAQVGLHHTKRHGQYDMNNIKRKHILQFIF